MATQNIPSVSVTCAGSVTFDATLVATGVSRVSADDAWSKLEHDMPSGVQIAAFLVALAAAIPSCGDECERSVKEEPVAGYSGSVTEVPVGTVKEKEYRYDWTWTVTVTVTCAKKHKPVLTPGRPELAAAGFAESGGEYVVVLRSGSELESGLRSVIERLAVRHG